MNADNTTTDKPETITVSGVIEEAGVYEPRFDTSPAGAYELVFDIKREDNNEVITIYLEVSMAMCGFKKDDITRYEYAENTLKSIGYKHGDDFSNIESLVGSRVDVYGKKQFSKSTGKEYWSWFFSSGNSRKKISDKARMTSLMEQFRAMRSGKTSQATANNNPFD